MERNSVKHLYNYKVKEKTHKFKRKHVNRWRIVVREFSFYIKICIFLALIFLSGFLLISYISRASFFKVKNIEISGTKNFVSKDDVLNIVKDNVKDDYLFNVRDVTLESKLENLFQGAKNIEVSKRFPSTLKVQVQERVPLAAVHNYQSNSHFLVDEDGYVLGMIDPENTNLPKVLYEEPLNVGIFIDKDLVPLYLELIGSIDGASLKTSSISVKNKEISFFIDNYISVSLSKDKDISESIDIVAKLYKQLKIEGKGVKKIDLRYDKVVVEYDE